MQGKTVCNRPLPLPRHDNLTVAEVARFLRVSERVIYEHVAGESLPHVCVGRLIRIPRGTFVGWYEGQQKPGG